MEVVEEIPREKRWRSPPATLPKSSAVQNALKDLQTSGRSKILKPRRRRPEPLNPNPEHKSPKPRRNLSLREADTPPSPASRKPLPALRKRKSLPTMSARPAPPQPPQGNGENSAQPVPVPRKRPPPPKPAPYSKHKEHQVNEITTFKSNVVAQPVLRSNPPVAAERKLNRVSLKGEPSEHFSRPKQNSKAPVEYGIPVIPKSVLDKRPRLDTPKVLPDPGIVPTVGRVSESIQEKPVEDADPSSPVKRTSETHPDVRPRLDTPFSPTHAGSSPEPVGVDSRPRLDTPFVPLDPAVVLPASPPALAQTSVGVAPPVTTSQSGAGTGSELTNGSTAPGEMYTYATVAGDEKEEEGTSDTSYAVIDRNLSKPVTKSLASPCARPASATPTPSPSPPPLPARTVESSELFSPSPTHGAAAASPLTPTSSLPDTSSVVQDLEYSSTSHMKLKPHPHARPLSTSPSPAPPTVADSEYSVTSHALSASTTSQRPTSREPSPSVKGDEYSHISIGQAPPPAPSTSGLVGGDEYSHLETTADKRVKQEPEYEIVTVPPPESTQPGSIPKRPPRKSPKPGRAKHPGKPSGPVPPPPTKPSPASKPPVTPSKPSVTPSKPSVTPSKPSTPPPKPSARPIPPVKPKVKPPPLAMKPSQDEEPITTDEDRTPLSVQISPKVELDIDSMIRARKQSRSYDQDGVSVDSFDSLGTPHELEGASRVRGASDKFGSDSYENQEVAPVSTQPGETYIVPLSPSETFTVPQHAVPGPLNYCEMDISDIPIVLSETSLTASGEVGVVANTHGQTDAQGYCHIDVLSPPEISKVPGPESEGGVKVGGGGEEEEGYALVPSKGEPLKLPAVSDDAPSTNTDDIAGQDLPTKPPRKPPPKPPRPPSSDIHSRTPSSDATGFEGSGEQQAPGGDFQVSVETTLSSAATGGSRTPPSRYKASRSNTQKRRRAPPPPPAASKSNVISSGLCTLPRSSPSHLRATAKPPLPTSRRKSEDPLSNSPVHKQFPQEPAPPPASLDPKRATLPVNSKPTIVESASSPGLKKKFKGLLKMPAGLRSSKRRNKKQNEKEEELSQSLSLAPASSKSLPRSAFSQGQPSFEAEEDDEELGGIYSTINETLPAGSSLAVKGGRGKREEEQEEEEDVPVIDEAGYDVIGARPLKKPKSKPSPHKKPTRSQSAEHLYEPAEFSGKGKDVVASGPTVPGPAVGAAEGSEVKPAVDIEEAEQNHVYALVMKKDKRKKQKKDADEDDKKMDDEASEATPPPLPVRIETPEDEKEEEVQKEEVEEQKEATEKEPEVQSGDNDPNLHMYAMVSKVSKKKKAASVEEGQQEEAKKEKEVIGIERQHSDPSPRSSPASKPRVPKPAGPKPPPVKPTPFAGKASSPGRGAPEAGFAGAWQGASGEKNRAEKARSPVRHAPPPPATKAARASLTPVSSTLPSSDMRTSRAASISSRPPAFPPPPPPPTSTPSPEPPEDDLGDHAYAVVDQSRNRAARLKQQANLKDADKMVHIDSVSKPGNRTSRAPHPYFTVAGGDEGEGQGTVSVPMKSHEYSTAGTGARGAAVDAKQKGGGGMKKHPSLPPRKSPPPPPPPSSSAAAPSQESRGEEDVDSGTRADGFLFSDRYAQNLIKVGESIDEQQEEVDSEAELCYSTEWETSSNGEEDEEEGREDQDSSEPLVPRSKTFHIAQEILTTERTFVKGLTLLDKDFRQAMKSANNAHEKPVITEENLRQILGNVGSILTLNSGLLEELEGRMKSWDERPLIGDILLGRAPYFKIYTEYISRFDNALKTLDEQKKNSVFSEVLQEFESQPKCANIPIAGHMLDIVQRITRYKLLFADYVKHLPEDSMDRVPSERALKVVSEVATHVNETIRQMDNFRKVVEVRKKLVGDSGETLITPSRKLLKEGELIKFSRREKQPRMFFLFNDILIYASAIPPTNNTYKVIKRIPVEGMKVDLLDDPEMTHAFQIISTCKSFWLEASNEKERMKWIEAFEKAIKEQGDMATQKQLSKRRSRLFLGQEDETDSAPLGSFAPPWLPDSSVSMCQLCSFNFTMTRRRHHCRACGMIFCGDCSCYSAPLKYKNSKPGRVCQTCFEKLGTPSDTKEDKSPSKRLKGRKQVSMPSVLREVKARDQSAQMSGYLHCSTSKHRHWKKRWFVLYDLVLYEFERHEDVSAKRSVTLPSYQVISPIPGHDDPLVFCLKHPGMGKEYFKADTEEQLEGFVEVLRKAVVGEIVVGEIEDTVSADTSQGSSSTSHTPTTTSPPPPPPSSSLSSHPSLTPHSEQDEEEEEEGEEPAAGGGGATAGDNNNDNSFDSS